MKTEHDIPRNLASICWLLVRAELFPSTKGKLLLVIGSGTSRRANTQNERPGMLASPEMPKTKPLEQRMLPKQRKRIPTPTLRHRYLFPFETKMV